MMIDNGNVHSDVRVMTEFLIAGRLMTDVHLDVRLEMCAGVDPVRTAVLGDVGEAVLAALMSVVITKQMEDQ